MKMNKNILQILNLIEVSHGYCFIIVFLKLLLVVDFKLFIKYNKKSALALGFLFSKFFLFLKIFAD